jgi:hypothetical protein
MTEGTACEGGGDGSKGALENRMLSIDGRDGIRRIRVDQIDASKPIAHPVSFVRSRVDEDRAASSDKFFDPGHVCVQEILQLVGQAIAAFQVYDPECR